MLPAEETRCLMRAAPLHDLGNVGIPDDLVRLEGNYTEEQRDQMREHTSLGAYLLHGAENGVLQTAESIALNHHERWDGLGYPRGLSHMEIPMAARIVAVADALDAMTHPGTVQGALLHPDGAGRAPARGGVAVRPRGRGRVGARLRASAGHAHHHAAGPQADAC